MRKPSVPYIYSLAILIILSFLSLHGLTLLLQSSSLLLPVKSPELAANASNFDRVISAVNTAYAANIFGAANTANTAKTAKAVNTATGVNAVGVIDTAATATPLTAPTGCRAYPGSGKAYLAWNQKTDANIAGYNVYCSNKPGQLGNKINARTIPKNSPYFAHSGLRNGTAYYYRIKTVGTSGNVSGPSAELVVKPAAPSIQKLAGSISKNTVLKSNTIYTVTGSITVSPAVTLTVEPGAIVKFNSGKNFIIHGTVRSVGMPNYKAYFTSIKDDAIGGDTNRDGPSTLPAAKNWSGFKMGAGGTVELYDSAIRYATNGIYYYAPAGYRHDSKYYIKKLSVQGCEIYGCYHGIYILGARDAYVASNIISKNIAFGIMVVCCEKPNFRNNRIDGNGTVGINSKAVELDPIALPNFIGNVVVNNAQNGAWVWNTAQKASDAPNKFSFTGANATLFSNITYILYGTTWVSPSTVFTIQAGTVVKGQPGALVVRGRLAAGGQQSRPITFTSYRDQEYGGNTYGSLSAPGSGDWGGIRFESGSSGTIANVRIKYATAGVSGINSNVSISNSILENNSAGVNNAIGGPQIIATNNWWGAPSGPKPFGSGNRVSGEVAVIPWLTSRPFQ